MKELTKEQLAEYVINIMSEVCKENHEKLIEELDNSKDTLGGLLGVCIGKTMQLCSYVLIETLDYLLNEK